VEYREGKGRRWRDMKTVYNVHNKKKRKTVHDYAEDSPPVCPV
jgi:hypothetical protein